MSRDLVTQVLYLVASLLFLLGMRGLTAAKTARRGVAFAEVGMLLAVVGTLIRHEIVRYELIVLGAGLGSVIGIVMALKIPMTKMPERIALSHAFGGLAVALVGVVEREHGLAHGGLAHFQLGAVGLEIVLGALTFTGSLMAFGKLQGLLPGRPLTFPGLNVMNVLAAATALGLVGYGVLAPANEATFVATLGIAAVLGVTLVLPIGGADMPVVICLLNSYAGLAAAATGFALHNNVLIICGALDGGSGFILGMMMSKAMNRSFTNVLFGAFGSDGASAKASGAGAGGTVKEAPLEDAVEILRAARTVIVIPGYGLAVSQAQHAVRDLAAALAGGGAEVAYAIHPVAGRMPGHMNVLLAEANIPYEQLFDLDAINERFASTDVALVIGANDVVNPAAKTTPGSPIYGMPILNADLARACLVLKRSMSPGFAGIENELFVRPQTQLVLGDAKKTLLAMVAGLKDEH